MNITDRPTVGKLVVPFVVDANRDPIDFRELDPEHVKRCATGRRCGVCGHKIRRPPLAFIGPADTRDCFADPWMHLECAELALQTCPFLSGRKDWREEEGRRAPLLQPYSAGMVIYIAQDGDAFRDIAMHWHFHALGPITRPA